MYYIYIYIHVISDENKKRRSREIQIVSCSTKIQNGEEASDSRHPMEYYHKAVHQNRQGSERDIHPSGNAR